MLRIPSLALVVVLTSAALASAQAVYLYDNDAPSMMSQAYTPTAAHPAGTPTNAMPLQVSFGNGLTAPYGGMACDQSTNRIYVTDGLTMRTASNPEVYGPFNPSLPTATGPTPIVNAPLVTGLAFDAATNTLWACSTTSFFPLSFQSSPIQLWTPSGPFTPIPGIGASPIQGLGFASSTGTLWACDAVGNVYNFTVGGAPVGTQPVATMPASGSPSGYVGMTVNTSNPPGSLPPPALSTQIQLPGGGYPYHVLGTDGVNIEDALAGGSVPPIAWPAAGTNPLGMCYSTDYQISPGFGGSVTDPSLAPLSGVSAAFVNSLPAPVGGTNLALAGGPPNSNAFLIADFTPLIPGLPTGVPGEILRFSPFSPTFVIAPAITDAAGDSQLPVVVIGGPTGVQFSFQWAIPDPLNPLFVFLTDATTVTLGSE